MRMLLLLLMMFTLSACALVDVPVEAVKTVWGSSTRSLEKARDKAIVQEYAFNYWDVMKSAEKTCKAKDWIIFKRDEVKGYFVLMGIKGAVNTTEVGVFFVELGEQKTRVEITSLSTNAKRLVAKQLFHGIDIHLGLAPPDPVDQALDEQEQAVKAP